MNNKRINKYQWLLLLLLSAFSLNAFSRSDCHFTYDQSFYSTTTSIGNVYVQRDSPVGTVLTTVHATVGGAYGNLYICSSQWDMYYEAPLFTVLSSLGNKIYDTNIRGVGVRLTDIIRTRVFPDHQVLSGQMAWDTPPTEYTIEIIKTVPGAVDGGELTQGRIILMNANQDTNIAEVNLTGMNKIIPVACSIKTPSLTFPIGDILASQFGTTVGTIPAGGQNTQNLGLDCDANANINVSLSGTQNPDVTTDSVLALTGQGNSDVAKGVGVQLLYNNTPLKLNNNIVLKKSTGGQETFPIVARYYQTKTSVTTGKANASATLNLTYQ